MAQPTRKTISAVVLPLLAAAVGGTYMLTDYINENLKTLQIDVIPGAAARPKQFDVNIWLQALAPVTVEGRAQLAKLNGEESVDAMFRSEPEPVVPPVPAPPPPDYAALLGTVMQLEGIGSNGAFITGKFYSVGEPIKDFEYPSNHGSIVPVIVEVRHSSVVIKHGSRLTELKT